MEKILPKLSLFILKNTRLITFCWFISIIICIITLMSLKSPLLERELSGAKNTEAYKVEKLLKEEFNFNPELYQAVVLDGENPDNSLKKILMKNFPLIENVEQVISPGKHNLKLYYIKYKPESTPKELQSLIQEVRKVLREWETINNSKTWLTGDTLFYFDTAVSGKKDSLRNEIFALILAFFILIFNFGGLIASLLPLVIGATTIIYLNTIVTVADIMINPLSQVLNSMIGLALAIDYSLFMVSRFSEENEKNSALDAISITLKNSGKTIIFSALIMFVSIMVLKIPDVSTAKGIVNTITLVIFISCFNSIFFLPAFLILFKNYLNKPEFISKRVKISNKYTFWKNISIHIVSNYRLYFVLSIIALFLLSIPVFNMKLWDPLQAITPENSESRVGYEKLEKDGWGGELIPVNVFVKAKNGENIRSEKGISFLYDYTRYLEKNPRINSVLSLTSLAPDIDKNSYIAFYNSVLGYQSFFSGVDTSRLVNKTGDITMLMISPKHLMNIHDTYEIINYSQEYAKKHKEFEIMTGGIVARSRDFSTELYSHIPLMLLIIFTSIFFLLYFYMKTPVLPIKAGIMNFIPIISAFGLLTLIFQYGYFSNILGTPVNHAVISMVPAVLFCVTFGLSMDYEVLILSRITEVYNETGDVKESVIEGLAKSGSVISGAAFILLAVFVPGIFSSSPIVKEICTGITAAILIDATIVRIFLVPSFMLMLGKWNWWNPFKLK